jgi:hypothetical protein
MIKLDPLEISILKKENKFEGFFIDYCALFLRMTARY